MNEGPVNQSNLIETTDCLEAIGVFRSWKNLFFVILLLCLLLVQAAFWLVDLKVIPADGTTPAPASATAIAPAQLSATPSASPAEPNAAAKLAAKTPAESNQPAGGASSALKLPGQLLEKLNTGHLARAVEFANGIMIITMVLYCLALFFSLMVSLVGRLGGIRHISRAFFLSVIMLVLVIPWQTLVGSRMPGVVYTFPELLGWLTIKNESMLNMVLYYLRFSGYWLIFLLLLFATQMRSGRWTKSILRRLEII
jgi:hypothetical protein